MTDVDAADAAVLCPSAQPEWAGSVALGVVGGTADAPRLAHFRRPLVVSEELLALSRPVSPTEVFRFAAPCLGSGCVHFRNATCGLAERVVELLPTVVPRLPPCPIRPDCRWWRQEGARACARCPQVVTDNHHPSEQMTRAAYGTDAIEPVVVRRER